MNKFLFVHGESEDHVTSTTDKPGLSVPPDDGYVSHGAITDLRLDPVPTGTTGDWLKIKSIAFTK